MYCTKYFLTADIACLLVVFLCLAILSLLLLFFWYFVAFVSFFHHTRVSQSPAGAFLPEKSTVWTQAFRNVAQVANRQTLVHDVAKNI